MYRNTFTSEILGNSPGFTGFIKFCPSVSKNSVQDIKCDGGLLVMKTGYFWRRTDICTCARWKVRRRRSGCTVWTETAMDEKRIWKKKVSWVPEFEYWSNNYNLLKYWSNIYNLLKYWSNIYNLLKYWSNIYNLLYFSPCFGIKNCLHSLPNQSTNYYYYVLRVLVFRCLRKIANGDYWIRHACLPVRMQQFGSHWTHFHEILYLTF